jgi:hypothetical protein
LYAIGGSPDWWGRPRRRTEPRAAGETWGERPWD